MSWERQSQLLEDGHHNLVYKYLKSKKLKLPTILEDWEDSDSESEPDDEGETPAARARNARSSIPQPQITAANYNDVLQLLTAPIGGEQPNRCARPPTQCNSYREAARVL